MSLVISKVFTYDTDAGNYIQAVEGPAGDNQALEPAVRQAINNFVVGCKQDGIWNAIKASCILAGARTLNGALVPLVGTAPTRFGTAGNWNYNRKTGLQGDGSTNYLNSNRFSNSDPQNNVHISVYVSSAPVASINGLIGDDDNPGNLQIIQLPTAIQFKSRDGGANQPSSALASLSGFTGLSRSLATSYNFRARGGVVSGTFASNSGTPSLASITVFQRGTTQPFATNARLAFYSIGESLDLAKLDSRVTDLINAFGAAIP